MADLRISELAALAGANLAAGDLLPVVDVSASETKKITVTDFTGQAVTLIADATIPGAKILFGSNQVPGTALANGGVTTTKLADDAVTAAKLGDESTVDLVTSLPVTGAFVGQLALDTTNLKIYCWNGSTWATIKASGSVNTFTGSGEGIVNVVITTSGDNVSISTTLDNTDAAGQFLAGPSSGAGAVGYRNIIGSDLPAATTSAKGGVIVNGEGLRMDGDTLELNNDVTANSTSYQVVQYSSKGLVTGGRDITAADLPAATAGAIGAVRPGTGLTMGATGALNHSNAIASGSAAKVSFDAQGHVTGTSNLLEADIPELPASKLTTGTLDIARIANNSVTGNKLANASTVKFGGAGSTAGVVTFPTAEFQGQYFFDALNGDLYLYDGAAWQPITITAGELIYAGTYDASANEVKSLTAAGTAAGLVIGSALPASSNNNLRYYLVVSDSGTGTAPAPAVALAPPDMIVSNGNAWELVDVSNGIAGQLASNISFTPYGGVAATNVQTAIQELEDDKLDKAGGTVTGNLEIGTTGSLTFEGGTANTFETTLAVTDPTADRTITLPDATGTVVLSGAIVNADINASAAIADTKLDTISTAGKVANSATTATSANTASAIVARDASGNFTAGTITATTFSGSGASLTSLPAGQLSGTVPSGVLGNSSLFVGTTSVALNRSSANQALTGISSVALPGSTSGTVTLLPTATAGTTTITLPATTGTVITTGDTGTVTNTMLAGSIADTKLSTISTAGKVSNSATTATNSNVASAIVARDASGNFAAGQIASVTGLVGTSTALTNVYSIATQLTPAVQVEGNTGSAAAVSITRQTSAAANLILQRGVTGTAVADAEAVGQINFNGYDGTNYINAALIRGIVDGTPGTGSMPGRLSFQTTPTGSSTPVERLRISANGDINMDGGTLFVDATNNRVGVGTSSVNGLLHLATAETRAILLNNSSIGTAAGDGTYISNKTDGSFAIINQENNSFTLGTNNTDRLTITGGGLVGIGANASSPSQQLHVRTDQAGYTWARIDNQSSSASAYSGLQLGAFGNSWGLAMGSSAANSNALTFVIDAGGSNSEKMRLDTSGRLLVGTSSSSAAATIVGQGNSINSAGSCEIYLQRGSATPANGDFLGTLVYADSGAGVGAQIAGVRDGGTWSASSKPTRLVFSTCGDGASSPTERLRINSSGFLKAGNTGSYVASAVNTHEFNHDVTGSSVLRLHASNTSFNNSAAYITMAATTVNGNANLIYAANGNASGVFVVQDSGNVRNTNNSYGAISDVKLKENIVDANSQWDDLKALQVRNYNFKEGQTHTQIGLVAQEAELVSPGLVTESPDRDAEGNDLGTVTKSVNYSVLYMKAVKALQEAMERIETLEASNTDLLARVSALESA